MLGAWREAASQSWTAARISPALDRRLAGPMMAGDEQHDAVAARDRLLERAVDRAPGAVEVHAVKVEDAVGLDSAASAAAGPSCRRASFRALARRWRGAPDLERRGCRG